MKTYTEEEVISLCREAFEAGQELEQCNTMYWEYSSLSSEEHSTLLDQDEWINKTFNKPL